MASWLRIHVKPAQMSSTAQVNWPRQLGMINGLVLNKNLSINLANFFSFYKVLFTSIFIISVLDLSTKLCYLGNGKPFAFPELTRRYDPNLLSNSQLGHQQACFTLKQHTSPKFTILATEPSIFLSSQQKMALFSLEAIIAIISGALSFLVAVVGLWFAYRAAYSFTQRRQDLEALVPADNSPLIPSGISSGSLEYIVAVPDVAHLRHSWSEPVIDRRHQVPPRMLRAKSLPH